MEEPSTAGGSSSVTALLRLGVFEGLVGFWYYQAAYLIGGGEVPGLSTRPAARCATMRHSRLIVVVPSPKYSFPILHPSTRACLLGTTGLREAQLLTKNPSRPDYCDGCMLTDSFQVSQDIHREGAAEEIQGTRDKH